MSHPPEEREEALLAEDDDDDGELPLCQSLFVHVTLPKIFNNKKKFLWSRKARKDGTVDPGKAGITYLYDLCVTYTLPVSGRRKELMNRLVSFFFHHPDEFEREQAFRSFYDANVWMKLKDIDMQETQRANSIIEKNESNIHDVQEEGAYPFTLLNTFFLMMKAGREIQEKVQIDSEGAFSYNSLRYNCMDVKVQMAKVPESEFTNFSSLGVDAEPGRRRSPDCILRLLTIIFLDDVVFERFIKEGKRSAQRSELDRGATGGDADIWRLIHQNFIDDDFAIADFFLDSDIYRDATGNLPDITKCHSKWATSADLRKWYNLVHTETMRIKKKFDRSGQHEFSFEGNFDANNDGYNEFVYNFAMRQRPVCYLAALAAHRGTDSTSDWFTQELPFDVPFVDGMGASDDNDDRVSVLGTSSQKNHSRTSRGGHGSSLGSLGDDHYSTQMSSAIDRLAMAIEGSVGNRASESPLHARLLKAQARKLEIENASQSQITKAVARKLELEIKQKEIEMENLELGKKDSLANICSFAERTQKAMVGLSLALGGISEAKKVSAQLDTETNETIQEAEKSVRDMFKTIIKMNRKRQREEEDTDSE